MQESSYTRNRFDQRTNIQNTDNTIFKQDITGNKKNLPKFERRPFLNTTSQIGGLPESSNTIKLANQVGSITDWVFDRSTYICLYNPFFLFPFSLSKKQSYG